MKLVDGTSVSKATRRTKPHASNGTFGAFRQPKVVGVSDAVALATTTQRREAARAMREWKRTLSRRERKTL